MENDVYIVVGNHRSVLGINEIVYCLYKSLSANFSIKLTRQLKNNRVNILIDEFSNGIDILAIEETRRRFPNTKIVIVATEFITPVSLFGVGLTRTFNYFGGPRDWRSLFLSAIRRQRRRQPSYMQLRYDGFTRAIKSCDVVVSVHPKIQPAVDKLIEEDEGASAPSLMIYPEFGPLSGAQENRLLTLPFGFSMTGTITPFRKKVLSNLVGAMNHVGCMDAPIGKSSFEDAPSAFPACDIKLHDSSFSFGPTETDYLFNINPPQTEEWPYSSPMRIYRAVMRGQVPIITRKFSDHPIENGAMLWDGEIASSRTIGIMKLSDRAEWISKFTRTLGEYDKVAHEGNRPFVNAVKSLNEQANVDTAT